MPNKASLGLVVILPDLFKATPYGIFSPSLWARLIFPLLIIEVDASKIKGILPVGTPKQIGLVPNKGFFAPWGAKAGGAFVKQKTIRFF